MHILDYDKVESGGKLRVEGSMHILDYDKKRLCSFPDCILRSVSALHIRRYPYHGFCHDIRNSAMDSDAIRVCSRSATLIMPV
jgi:hypothetical protein